MRLCQTRRIFLSEASSAAAAVVLNARGSSAAEPLPEIQTVRLRKSTVICFAPLYVLEAFLKAEGFTEVIYSAVEEGDSVGLVERGELHFDAHFAGGIAHALGLGVKVTTLGGLHAGCYELFAREPIRTIGDLKGRRVGIHRLNSGNHVYLSIMAAYVGLDPARDIEWVSSKSGRALDLFAAGEADAYLGFPPEPQELRERGYNRVILNTITDRPWSQYFCCMIYGNQGWIRSHPIATKRFLRAIYKAADYCTAEPESAARRLVEGGFTKRYDYALETIAAVQYQKWHDYDPEDTMRFYALRLHEAGMIETNPNKVIAAGTNWRFFDELKQEMKV